MRENTPAAVETQEPMTSLRPSTGWHVLHLFYRLDRGTYRSMTVPEKSDAASEWLSVLDPALPNAPSREQLFLVPGQKADFGLILADPDPLKLHDLQLDLESSAIGPALVPAYSFTSITEVSEYVPDADAYGAILREREGLDPESSIYRTKLAQYENRLAGMNRQRLEPDFPEWPCLFFYPMNKLRVEGQNWYMLPFQERMRLMAEHGKSGAKFAGRVSQLITASTGLDDWEWGVTLWGRSPSDLKDIVYTMRFDEASARYAQFGPFFQGYLAAPEALRSLLRI
jgi:chlorite dismutase